MPLRESVVHGEKALEMLFLVPSPNSIAAKIEVTVPRHTPSPKVMITTTVITDARMEAPKVISKHKEVCTTKPHQFHHSLMRMVALRSAIPNGERIPGTNGFGAMSQDG